MNKNLSFDHPRNLFRPPSRAIKCRQLVYAKAKEIGKPIAIADLVRDNPEFRSAEIYRAARALVTHGILSREDISWAVLEKGSERTRYRAAVTFVEPFTANTSRVW